MGKKKSGVRCGNKNQLFPGFLGMNRSLCMSAGHEPMEFGNISYVLTILSAARLCPCPWELQINLMNVLKQPAVSDLERQFISWWEQTLQRLGNCVLRMKTQGKLS